MREIKFRAWDKDRKEMLSWENLDVNDREGLVHVVDLLNGDEHDFIPMQYTGLKDRDGLIDIYEGDILGVNGLVEGNKYEAPNLLEGKSNIVVPSITSKEWHPAHKKMLERGCKHSE